ncbi:hypothetical protein F511_26085 [Dorcoceras hygrometricum]|uniref:Uncharacterized protein n=1 Tax=Dorcoceras hygrometricum TaxID=472368 RepID=A0A2Z7DKU6_9LAMI|nr:hypothetical protein F511_26085 [Dorcoceras hygrometricum]
MAVTHADLAPNRNNSDLGSKTGAFLMAKWTAANVDDPKGHTYLLVAVSNSDPLFQITWDFHSDFAKTSTLQAGFYFTTTWISFAVAEILLLIGLSVESGHLKNWGTPRPNCVIIQHGLFTSAGVFGLLTVFLASGLYVTALRAERWYQEQENNRRRVLEASVFYQTPPISPRPGGININLTTVANENPMPSQHQNSLTLYQYLRMFEKQSNLV